MKMLVALACWLIVAGFPCVAEKEVWYDAQGKVYKVTRSKPAKEVYVPAWKQRELDRQARMQVLRTEKTRVQRTRSGYWDPYGIYYSGYGYRYGHGWSCRPGYDRGYHGSSRRSLWRVQGSYHRSGWSLRVRF